MQREQELLFLMINLAQIVDIDRLVYFYQDFMNQIFPEAVIHVSEGEIDYRAEYPISTLTHSWGRVEIESPETLDKNDLSLFRNSVSLLSIIIDNRIMYQKMTEETEEAVKKSELAEDITERFFNISPDLLCIASTNGYFIKLNHNWSKLLGWSEEELKARPWTDFVHPEDKGETTQAREDLSQGNRVLSFENRYISKSGHYYWLSWNSMLIPQKNLIFAVARDITAEKAELRRKHQNDKMHALGQLAGGVAHDFNNQLTGIMGFAELALSETPPDSPVHGYLENIIQSVTRSKDLTFQLLAYARKGNKTVEKINLGLLINEVCMILKRTTSPSIIIEQHIDKKYCWISGDASQIQNMLLNLGLNARDALPGGGYIKFSTSLALSSDLERIVNHPIDLEVEPFLCLLVEDTGEGIPPEIWDKIYDPFFTTKPMHKGTGIGLSAVLGTVKGHEGFILMDSQIGKGSCFKLFFPALL